MMRQMGWIVQHPCMTMVSDCPRTFLDIERVVGLVLLAHLIPKDSLHLTVFGSAQDVDLALLFELLDVRRRLLPRILQRADGDAGAFVDRISLDLS